MMSLSLNFKKDYMCICVYIHECICLMWGCREQLREVVSSLHTSLWILGIELRYPGLHSRPLCPQSHLARPQFEFLDVSVSMNYTIIP